MSSREKDSSDFDLEQFVDLFDTAMCSDNPAVQRAFKNLLLVATIADSSVSGEQRVKGPLRSLVDSVGHINRRMNQLESNSIKKYAQASSNGTASGYYDQDKWNDKFILESWLGPTMTPAMTDTLEKAVNKIKFLDDKQNKQY